MSNKTQSKTDPTRPSSNKAPYKREVTRHLLDIDPDTLLTEQEKFLRQELYDRLHTLADHVRGKRYDAAIDMCESRDLACSAGEVLVLNCMTIPGKGIRDLGSCLRRLKELQDRQTV